MPSSGGGLKSNQKISGYPYDIYDNTASGDRPYQAGLFGICQSSKMGKMTIASSFLVECRGPSSAVKAILYRWTFQDSAGLVSPDCVTRVYGALTNRVLLSKSGRPTRVLTITYKFEGLKDNKLCNLLLTCLTRALLPHYKIMPLSLFLFICILNINIWGNYQSHMFYYVFSNWSLILVTPSQIP